VPKPKQADSKPAEKKEGDAAQQTPPVQPAE
jgi:hypothetical protein